MVSHVVGDRLTTVIPKLVALCDAVVSGYCLPADALRRIDEAAAETLALCRAELTLPSTTPQAHARMSESIRRCERLLSLLRRLANVRATANTRGEHSLPETNQFT